MISFAIFHNDESVRGPLNAGVILSAGDLSPDAGNHGDYCEHVRR
jgi:hypothetical protein